MNKGRTKKNAKFILIILVLCIVAFGGAMLLKKDDDVLSGVMNMFETDTYIKDNYNGVYVYRESLGGSTHFFKGCSAEHVDHYIAIVNDKYYTYSSSCIGTFAFEEGKSKDLKIYTNEESKKFYIKYNDLVYTKDAAIRNIELQNNAVSFVGDININNYQTLFKQSQFEGGYYNVDKRKIGSLSVTLYIDIKHVKDEQFSIIIKDKLDVVHYSYTFDDFDHMPLLYPYGAYLVILEKNETSDRYMHNIKVIGEKGLVYNMYDHFPIVVDDINLDQNMNIYATFDKYTRKFKVLISNNKKMCVENGTTNDVTYYEFTVDYNYNKKGFDRPEFVKQGYAKDGCSYIDDIMGGK